MSDLARAIQIATQAHRNQFDKGGAPYIAHPTRVMNALATESEKIVGILHDVCEDSPEWTFERIAAEGFAPEIVDALRAVTKREGEDYDSFVRRAAENPIGRNVKIADLIDNSDLRRIANPTEKDYARISKYRAALSMLTGT